jgi:FMN phosphatase YigB (HAD superfamily)
VIALFDIGSTLIEGPAYGPARRLAEMLGCEAAQVPTIERLLFRTPSANAAELAAVVASALAMDVAQVEAACALLWNAQLQEAYTLPGALEAIGRLDVPRAYLSNIWPPFYEHFRRAFPEEAARPQFLSFQLGLSKPDVAFFEHALAALDVPAREVVMIGDTYTNDIAPAIALGMRTVWVLHRPDKERASLVRVLNGEAPRPDVTLASIKELEPCVLKNLS